MTDKQKESFSSILRLCEDIREEIKKGESCDTEKVVFWSEKITEWAEYAK